MKWLYRRFVPIGSKEIMDRFEAMCERKNLSRAELLLILCAIELNPSISAKEMLERAIERGDL